MLGGLQEETSPWAGLWALGLWALGCGLWAVGCGAVGLWAVGCGAGCGLRGAGLGLWAVGCGLWAVGCVGCGLAVGCVWVLGSGLWALGSGLWAVGSGLWAAGCGLRNHLSPIEELMSPSLMGIRLSQLAILQSSPKLGEG